MGWRGFEPTKRREARGGIKANSKRGSFGQTWWGRRWMQALESFGMESRLTRGRSYARSGQVLTLESVGGAIQASVQGSRATPYKITILLATFTPGDWERALDRLRAEPGLVARLLAGEMPEEIENVFARADLALFPRRSGDIRASCSCPDWGDPCKHVAAVYCLLAEEFDRDPFVLFALRGKDRDALLGALAASEVTEGDEMATALPPEPLPADPVRFWEGEGRELPAVRPGDRPRLSAPLVRRLGPFPLWRAETPLLEAITPWCDAASDRLLAADRRMP